MPELPRIEKLIWGQHTTSTPVARNAWSRNAGRLNSAELAHTLKKNATHFSNKHEGESNENAHTLHNLLFRNDSSNMVCVNRNMNFVPEDYSSVPMNLKSNIAVLHADRHSTVSVKSQSPHHGHTPPNIHTLPAGTADLSRDCDSYGPWQGRPVQPVGRGDVQARRPPSSIGIIPNGRLSSFDASHTPLPPMVMASSDAIRTVATVDPLPPPGHASYPAPSRGAAGWAGAAAERGRPDALARRAVAMVQGAAAARPLPVVDVQFVYNTIVDGLAGHVLVDTRCAALPRAERGRAASSSRAPASAHPHEGVSGAESERARACWRRP
jgi:hypothetical protein